MTAPTDQEPRRITTRRDGWVTHVVDAARQQPLSLAIAVVVAIYPGPLTERILAALASVVLIGVAERRLGWVRALIAAAAGVVAAGTAAAVTTFAAQRIAADWATDLATHPTFAPLTPSLAALMAASAVVGPLWRRRIRLLGFAAIIALVLYDGRASSIDALLGALAGLLVGRLLREGGATPVAWARSSRHEARILLSGVVALTAVGPLITLSAHAPVGLLAPLGGLFRDRYAVSRAALERCAARPLFPAQPPLSETCLRDSALAGAHGPGTIALSVLPLVTLLIAAALIRRGSRLAVLVAIGVDLLLGVLALVYYAVLPLAVDPETGVRPDRFRVLVVHGLSIAAPLAVALLLLVFLRHFAVETPKRVRRAFAATIVTGFVVLLALYLAVALSHSADFRPRGAVAQLVLLAPQRFVPIGFIGPEHLGPVPMGGLARIAFDSVGAVFWLLLAVALLVAARRAEHLETSGDDRARVRAILRRGSAGSLSHLATWPGNAYWFTPDGLAAVAYRRIGTTAITLGDPLGDPDRRPEVVALFAAWCDDEGLTPVFYSVSADLRGAFDRIGWTTIQVAEETTIRPREFRMQGKKWQDIRSSINRAAANGVRAEWTRFAELPAAILRQIEEISEAWVADKDLPEMGFTLGSVEEMDDPDVRLMLAVDGDSRVLAVTSWLPTWRDGVVVGWTLDFMRRAPETMNGVMEFLIASTTLRAQADRMEFVSLSAAPLATQDPASASPSQTERLLTFLSRTLEPSYAFRSLLTFKLKFQPELEPLLMAYPDPLQLPVIGTALARAYMPTLSPRRIPSLLRRGGQG